MDRKETELTAGESAERVGTKLAAEADAQEGFSAPKTAELFRQGEELYALGFFDRAIHVWTRILFLERGHPEARRAIDEAKRVIAERQRRLDSETAEALQLLESGDVDGARERVESVLAVDASHVEAGLLAAEIATLERRSDAGREAAIRESPEAAPAPKGVVLRVGRAQGGAREAPGSPIAARLKMTAFVLAASILFAGSALYLYENWDSLVSDGAFAHPSGAASSVPSEGPATPVPDLAELRYYNASRLFSEGRYREALSELTRIDRSSPVMAEARSLILRIEERLLRGASEPDAAREAAESSRPDADSAAPR